MAIKAIEVKTVMTKSNLPVADFSVNPFGKMKNLKALLDDVFPDIGFAI